MTFPFIHETKKINASLREKVEGNFIALPDGYTHYEMTGEPNAETVVLVHGFSVPYFIWEPTFSALKEAGYRVLRYDLFGRGYSDRPNTDYTLKFFAKQLLDLLDALQITQPINPFGLSMGGPISATCTANHPKRIKKLALFAPAGGAVIPLSLQHRILLIPGIGELLMGLFGKKTLLDSIAADFYAPELIAYFTKKYAPQLQYRGFGRGILSTMRGDALGDSTAVYQRVGETGIPTLLVWGRDDQTVPYAQSQQVAASLKPARFETIENSGHIPHYENADEVNSIIFDFLSA